MAARITESAWRQKRWEWHGQNLYIDIKRRFGKKKFTISDVANLDAITHLSDRTAYDVSTAVCRELELRKKLKRQGRIMYLHERKIHGQRAISKISTNKKN